VTGAYAHAQRLVSVVKLATVLVVCILPKSSVLLCVFFGQTDSMKRIFILECFLFTVGSVSRVKRFADDVDVETEV
jgi:hypothetical protein